MKPNEITTLIRSLFTRAQPWIADGILLLARLTIGWSFFLTGKGKLANLERTTGFFDSLGIPAPGFHAAFVGGVEMIGGLLLVAGLISRIAAVPLAGAMVVAYLTAHREDAFASFDAFADESPFAYLLVALVILAFGPGRASLDAILKRALCKDGQRPLQANPQTD